MLSVTEAIGAAAVSLIEEHAPAHGLQLAEALIAATARQTGLPLVSGNSKHFGPIPALDLRSFRPAAK